MKRIFLAALIGVGMMALSFPLFSGRGAASVPSETVNPQSDEFYAQREKNASQEIRQQLEQFRREIRKNNWSYAVGYTTAMDRSMDELAGTRIPDDLADQYRRKNALLSRRRNTDSQDIAKAVMV